MKKTSLLLLSLACGGKTSDNLSIGLKAKQSKKIIKYKNIFYNLTSNPLDPANEFYSIPANISLCAYDLTAVDNEISAQYGFMD